MKWIHNEIFIRYDPTCWLLMTVARSYLAGSTSMVRYYWLQTKGADLCLGSLVLVPSAPAMATLVSPVGVIQCHP